MTLSTASTAHPSSRLDQTVAPAPPSRWRRSLRFALAAVVGAIAVATLALVPGTDDRGGPGGPALGLGSLRRQLPDVVHREHRRPRPVRRPPRRLGHRHRRDVQRSDLCRRSRHRRPVLRRVSSPWRRRGLQRPSRQLDLDRPRRPLEPLHPPGVDRAGHRGRHPSSTAANWSAARERRAPTTAASTSTTTRPPPRTCRCSASSSARCWPATATGSCSTPTPSWDAAATGRTSRGEPCCATTATNASAGSPRSPWPRPRRHRPRRSIPSPRWPPVRWGSPSVTSAQPEARASSSVFPATASGVAPTPAPRRSSPNRLDRSAPESLRQGRDLTGRAGADDFVGASVATGDIDCNGRDDLAVGAPGERLGRHDDAGLVVVTHGTGPQRRQSADPPGPGRTPRRCPGRQRTDRCRTGEWRLRRRWLRRPRGRHPGRRHRRRHRRRCGGRRLRTPSGHRIGAGLGHLASGRRPGR